MWQEELARVWGGLTKEALQELTDWRWEHPKATLKEIEELVDGSLARVRARLLQEVALASDAREVSGEQSYARIRPVQRRLTGESPQRSRRHILS